MRKAILTALALTLLTATNAQSKILPPPNVIPLTTGSEHTLPFALQALDVVGAISAGVTIFTAPYWINEDAWTPLFGKENVEYEYPVQHSKIDVSVK